MQIPPCLLLSIPSNDPPLHLQPTRTLPGAPTAWAETPKTKSTAQDDAELHKVEMTWHPPYMYIQTVLLSCSASEENLPVSPVPPYHINSSDVFSICSIALKQTVKPNLGQDIPSQCPSKHVVFSPPMQLKWRFSLLLIQYYHQVLNRVNS